jgi:hypothetical protein
VADAEATADLFEAIRAADAPQAAADTAWSRQEATRARITDLWTSGRLGGHQALRCLRALRTGADGDVLAMLLGAVFTEDQLETLPRAWALGADPWEVLLLGVHGRNCEGEDLPIVGDDALRARMETALGLAQERPSDWLADYTALLVDEWERRRADAAAFPRST